MWTRHSLDIFVQGTQTRHFLRMVEVTPQCKYGLQSKSLVKTCNVNRGRKWRQVQLKVYQITQNRSQTKNIEKSQVPLSQWHCLRYKVTNTIKDGYFTFNNTIVNYKARILLEEFWKQLSNYGIWMLTKTGVCLSQRMTGHKKKKKAWHPLRLSLSVKYKKKMNKKGTKLLI